MIIKHKKSFPDFPPSPSRVFHHSLFDLLMDLHTLALASQSILHLGPIPFLPGSGISSLQLLYRATPVIRAILPGWPGGLVPDARTLRLWSSVADYSTLLAQLDGHLSAVSFSPHVLN